MIKAGQKAETGEKNLHGGSWGLHGGRRDQFWDGRQTYSSKAGKLRKVKKSKMFRICFMEQKITWPKLLKLSMEIQFHSTTALDGWRETGKPPSTEWVSRQKRCTLNICMLLALGLLLCNISVHKMRSLVLVTGTFNWFCIIKAVPQIKHFTNCPCEGKCQLFTTHRCSQKERALD